jgi:hypothetical protein
MVISIIYNLKQIEIYSPDSLIVGTRGRDGAFGGLLPGSMSKYCLQHSPVPVVVVHPFYRRQHRKQKRERDPDRQSYIQLLKHAKEYTSSSSDSLYGHIPEVSIPEISVENTPADTPESLSPDEELPIKKDVEVTVREVEGEDKITRPALTHAITDPTPLKGSESTTGNIFPAEKG